MNGTPTMTRPRPADLPRLATRAIAILAALGTVALGLPTAASAATDPSADPAATPTATPAVPVGTVTAELVTFPDPVAAPGQSLRALARVTNATAQALDDAVVEIAVTTSPLSTAQAIDAFVSNPAAPRAAVASTPVGAVVELAPGLGAEPEVTPTTVHRLQSGSSTLVAVTVPPEALALPADAWGVYGLTVTLVTATSRVPISAGVITWEGAGVPALSVAPLVAAWGAGADMSVVTDAAGLRAVTIATDGTQLVGLDAGGVALSGRSVLRMPAFVPDVTSLAHAQESTLLAYALERSRGTAQSATHDSAWISPVAVLDASSAQLLTSQGASAALVLSDAAGTDAVPVGTASVDSASGLALIAPEPTVSAAVAAAPTLEAPATAVAKAALLAAQATGPVVISPDPAWLAPGADATAFEAVLAAPFVTTVDVTQVWMRDDAPVAAIPADDQATAEDVSAASIAGQAHRLERGNALAVTVEEPGVVLNPLGSMILEPLATTLRSQPDRRATALASASRRADALLGSLTVPAGSDINLIAAKGSVPVNVRNALTVPAQVTVDVTSFSPNLQVRDAPTVTVPAASSMTVLVEVEAVSTADVNASIVLRNADGTALGPSTALSVRVRADWGNAATAVFTAGLVLLLVMGVVRTVRRGRKDTRTGPQEEPAEPAAGDDA